MENFSVITSVYKNDDPEFVRMALESITKEQTVKPSEVVLVVDGPVPETLAVVIKAYERQEAFHLIWLPQNQGLGNALRIGTETATNELVARMDSDDIAQPDRFEKQLAFMTSHPEVSIVGGQMTEFIGEPTNIVGRRIVPTDDAAIQNYMKSRCAMNHVTVMFRRQAVLGVGNYKDWFWNEDYYLWVRMMIAGCKFANLPDVLVNVRSGSDQYARRGGRKYYESEKGILRLMLDNGIIGRPRYIFNVFVRWCIQCAMPNWLRGFVFRTLFRKK